MNFLYRGYRNNKEETLDLSMTEKPAEMRKNTAAFLNRYILLCSAKNTAVGEIASCYLSRGLSIPAPAKPPWGWDLYFKTWPPHSDWHYLVNRDELFPVFFTDTPDNRLS